MLFVCEKLCYVFLSNVKKNVFAKRHYDNSKIHYYILLVLRSQKFLLNFQFEKMKKKIEEVECFYVILKLFFLATQNKKKIRS